MAQPDICGQPLSLKQKLLFDYLAGLAGKGGPCPGNRDIAAGSGLEYDSVPGFLGELARKGAIAIERDKDRCRRIVIVSTGLATGWGARSLYRKAPSGLDSTGHADAEQRRRDHEAYWLEEEQRKYGLRRRGKALSEMVA